MNYLSSNIRYLRRKAGQNQAELAKNFGKKQNTVGNWENGVSEPSIKELVALSQIFMVKIEELVNRDLEHKEAAVAGQQMPVPDARPDINQENLPLSSQDREMDGFWMVLRELRSMNEKLDALGRQQGLGNRQSGANL